MKKIDKFLKTEQSGITLISLVITIIVLIILATIAVNTGIDTINSSKLTKFNAEMKIMQLKVNEWYDEWKNGNENILNQGESITYGNDDVVAQANKVFTVEEADVELSTDENAINYRDNYRYYSNAYIKQLGIEGVEQEFFINLKQRKIVSYKGLRYKGITCYTIEQLPQMDIYNVENVDPNDGEPTFKLRSTVLEKNKKWKIEVYDIEYVSGYIAKWDLKYRLQGTEDWMITKNSSFEVTQPGTYEVMIGNREIQSAVKTQIIEKTEETPQSGEWNGTVNTPKVAEGMIPIKWDTTKSKWIVCSQTDADWYNYVDQASGIDQKSIWANMMLSDGTYKSNTVNVGQEIEESELGSMFVWIPRYAYSIESRYHTKTAGVIKVAFLEGTKTYATGAQVSYSHQGTKGTAQLTNASGQGNWNEHPAFNYGGKTISGIWVAKFQASSSNPSASYGGSNVTDLTVKSKPNVASWKKITIGNIYTNCINMNKEANEYGLNANDSVVDPHLLKNTEWGAAAYLTHSSYGRNGNEIYINNNSNYITGIAADTASAGESAYATNTYATTKGVLASTTGNTSGIYDMSGCAMEYVAGYVNNGNGNLTTYGEPLVNSNIQAHKDVYGKALDDGQANTYNLMSKKIGDAIYETSNSHSSLNGSWNNDYSRCPYFAGPFFMRGGGYYDDSTAGSFCFAGADGTAGPRASFRPAVAVL